MRGQGKALLAVFALAVVGFVVNAWILPRAFEQDEGGVQSLAQRRFVDAGDDVQPGFRTMHRIQYDESLYPPIPAIRDPRSGKWKGDCVIRKLAPPKATMPVPHVYDVFAADELANVYFISQRYFGRCNSEKEVYDPAEHNFLDKVFLCEFVDPEETREREMVFSKRTYKKDAYSSTTIISCPIPERFKALANNDGKLANLNVSLVPIHDQRPGKQLPRLNNLPVCANPIVNEDVVFNHSNEMSAWKQTKHSVGSQPSKEESTGRKHYVSGCIWTTGDTYIRVTESLHKSNISDILPRVKEWLMFHKMVGIDHFYIYDNSATKHSELYNVLKPFIEQGYVTYIHWPPKICFRHRASQYAAENSCIRRFAQFNTWLIHFDVDEYLVPVGEHTNLKSVLKQYEGDKSIDALWATDSLYGTCKGEPREHQDGKLFLEEKHCWTGKDVDFKKKEFIKPYQVYYHFVHYSEATWSGKRANSKKLDSSKEIRMVHARNGVHTERSGQSDPKVLKWADALKTYMTTQDI